MCAYYRAAPHSRRAPCGAACDFSPIRWGQDYLGNPCRAATAVRLGRYLDVEITLVHRGRTVMPGSRCPPPSGRGTSRRTQSFRLLLPKRPAPSGTVPRRGGRKHAADPLGDGDGPDCACHQPDDPHQQVEPFPVSVSDHVHPGRHQHLRREVRSAVQERNVRPVLHVPALPQVRGAATRRVATESTAEPTGPGHGPPIRRHFRTGQVAMRSWSDRATLTSGHRHARVTAPGRPDPGNPGPLAPAPRTVARHPGCPFTRTPRPNARTSHM